MVSGRRSVGAGETNPANPLHLGHGAQQVGEEGSGPGTLVGRPGHPGQIGRGPPLGIGAQRGGQVPPVGVDVLAQQRDLHHPVGGQLLDLSHHLGEGPAGLGPADRRHDAERAVVVTPDLDGDPTGPTLFPAYRHGRGERLFLRVGGIEDLDRGPAAGPGLPEQVAGPPHVVRPPHGVDPRGPGGHGVAVLLGQTATHRDLQVGPTVLLGLEMAERPVQLVVCVLPDATGVEDDDVGVVHPRGRHQPVRFHESGQAFGVMLVHLAPEGPDQVATGVGHARKATPEAGAEGPRAGRHSTSRRMAVRLSPSIWMSANVGRHVRSSPTTAT
jgi:hypothetical protein